MSSDVWLIRELEGDGLRCVFLIGDSSDSGNAVFHRRPTRSFVLYLKKKKCVSLAFRASDNGWSHSLMLLYVSQSYRCESSTYTP